jgi:branched-chain amino acid aminotransferase
VHVDGEIVNGDQAAVDVHAHAVSYGTGTFEGIRAYWNADHEQLYLGEVVGHYERLHRSARILGLSVRFPVDELVTMTKELLRANKVRAHAYVRPILLQVGAVLPVRMHDGSLCARPNRLGAATAARTVSADVAGGRTG